MVDRNLQESGVRHGLHRPVVDTKASRPRDLYVTVTRFSLC